MILACCCPPPCWPSITSSYRASIRTSGRELGVSDFSEILLDLNDSEGLISKCLESQLALARPVRYLNGEVDNRTEPDLRGVGAHTAWNTGTPSVVR